MGLLLSAPAGASKRDTPTSNHTESAAFVACGFCEDLASDWLQHNKHSRHILGVHGYIISTVIMYIQLLQGQPKVCFHVEASYI